MLKLLPERTSWLRTGEDSIASWLKLTNDPTPMEIAESASQLFTDREPSCLEKQLSFTTIFSSRGSPSNFKFTMFSKLLDSTSRLLSFLKTDKSMV